MENPTLKLEGQEGEGVQLRLNLKGIYTWTINVAIKEGDTPGSITGRLDSINIELEKTFPNHARKGTGRMAEF